MKITYYLRHIDVICVEEFDTEKEMKEWLKQQADNDCFELMEIE